jgi:hypothetical protein
MNVLRLPCVAQGRGWNRYYFEEAKGSDVDVNACKGTIQKSIGEFRILYVAAYTFFTTIPPFMENSFFFIFLPIFS